MGKKSKQSITLKLKDGKKMDITYNNNGVGTCSHNETGYGISFSDKICAPGLPSHELEKEVKRNLFPVLTYRSSVVETVPSRIEHVYSH